MKAPAVVLAVLILAACNKKNSVSAVTPDPQCGSGDSVKQITVVVPPFVPYYDTFYGLFAVTEFVVFYRDTIEMYVYHSSPGVLRFTKVDHAVDHWAIGGFTDHYNINKNNYYPTASVFTQTGIIIK